MNNLNDDDDVCDDVCDDDDTRGRRARTDDTFDASIATMRAIFLSSECRRAFDILC